MPKGKQSAEIQIQIPAPNIQTMTVKIKGTAPIIFHKWSEKAKRQIRDKQSKRATAGREVRNPTQEYLDSFYYTQEGTIAFPALALKQALVGAARNIEGITMAELRGMVFVLGDMNGMIPLLYKNKPLKPAPTPTEVHGSAGENIYAVDPKTPVIELREDMVRIGMGSADLRYRGQVKEWELQVMTRFNANKLSAEQVLNLMQYAGFACGLGEWRPEKNGNFGTFEVVQTSKSE